MKWSMRVRDPKDALESPFGAKLRACERRIREHDGESLLARWEFGQTLLRERQGKQLPNGLLALIGQQLQLSRWEIQQRIRFAEKYRDKAQVFDAIKHFPSWYVMTHQGLGHRVKVRRKAAPPPPGRFTMELYRVSKWLTKIEPSRLTAQDLIVLENLRTQCSQMIEAAKTTSRQKETHA
jgi:hypothetical protein